MARKEEGEDTTKVVGLKELMQADDLSKTLPQVSFEQGLKLLEELVERVETGGLPLDKSLLAYERGVALVDHLRGVISGAEEKLKILQKPQAR